MKTLVINRDQDTRRLEWVKAQIAEHPVLEPIRFPAINAFDETFSIARSLPPGISLDVPVPDGLKERGTLGCVLSHAHCWHIVAEGEDEAVLILEDDAELTKNVPRMISDVLALDRFDLVFVNQRMKLYRKHLDEIRFRGAFLPVDLFHAEMSCAFAEDEFATRWNSPRGRLDGPPGGDGYILSPAGARKLLDAFRRLGRVVHADWLLYAMALNPATLEAHPNGPRYARFLSGLAQGQAPLLESYIYAHPAVRHAGARLGGSVRGGTAAGDIPLKPFADPVPAGWRRLGDSKVKSGGFLPIPGEKNRSGLLYRVQARARQMFSRQALPLMTRDNAKREKGDQP